MKQKVLTIARVQELVGTPSADATRKWLRRHGITNRESERTWRVFESDVLAVLLRPGERVPVDHVKEGADDFDKHFGESSWPRH
jgi:hypothetical protein